MEPIILDSGKYNGKSLEYVLEKDPKYLEYIYYNSGYGSKVKDWIWSHMEEIRTAIKTKQNETTSPGTNN